MTGRTRKKSSASQRSALARWRRARRIRRDARTLLKESRRVLRKYAHRLKEPISEQIREAAAALGSARKARDVEGMRDNLDRLDRLLEQHLSFARKSALREYTESIGIAVLIALLLRAFVVEAFKIPSGSMIPTLKVGDHIFVNKFIYGLRVPFTRIKFFSSLPSRGDVVVFIFPEDETKDFIKRIVAVGGDTVAVRNNVIYLNGKPVNRHRLPGPCRYRDGEEGSEHWEIRPCVAYQEQLGGTRYRVIQDVNGFPLDMAPRKIPEGHVFVMGDNRDNSHDSRAWGTVPGPNIKGKALIIWWSSSGPAGVRWGRFFDLVHSLDASRQLTPLGEAHPP